MPGPPQPCSHAQEWALRTFRFCSAGCPVAAASTRKPEPPPAAHGGNAVCSLATVTCVICTQKI